MTRRKASSPGKCRSFLLLFFLAPALSACRGEVRLPRPEDVLDRILLEYPSVLGYVRIHPENCRVLQGPAGEEDASFLGLSSLLGLAAGFPPALMDEVIGLARQDSHIILILLDPALYGGPAALHFESSGSKSLAAVLDAREDFARVPGRDPPEYTPQRTMSMERRIMGLLSAIGFDLPLEAGSASRIVVEETATGTLVMPSMDLSEDFKTFLEDSDALRPWGDAGLVINLEVHRLARAYAEEARKFNRSMAEFLRRTAGMIRAHEAAAGALERMAMLAPEAALEAIRSVEGIRYVSRTPWKGQPELTLLPSEGGALSRMLSILRGGGPDLIGLMPTGLALQLNTDSLEAARLMKEALLFYRDTVALEDEVLDRNLGPALASMANDTGQYLAGIDIAAGDAGFVLMSALEPGAREPSSDTAPGASMIAPMLDLIFPGERIPARAVGGGILRYEFPWGDDLGRTLLFPCLETGMTEGLRVTTVRAGTEGGTGDWTRRSLGLRGHTSGRHLGLPEGAALYLRLALPQAFYKSFVPGIENIVSLGIMGYGVVEENRLVVNFMR